MSEFEAKQTGDKAGQIAYASELGSVSLFGECYISYADLAAIAPTALQDNRLDLLQQLPGAYSIIVERGGDHIIHTDPSAQFPLYWQTKHGELNISLEAGKLSTNQPNLEFLAANIIGCPEIALGQTALTGVNRLEGGETAHFKNGTLLRVEESLITSDPSLTLEEAAADLRSALEEAVDVRLALNGVITSDFSGGFDSTLLTLVAATRSGKTLDAFIQYFPRMAVGDLAYARAIAAENPDIRLHEILENIQALPYQALGESPIRDEPDAGIILRGRCLQRLLTAQAYGSTQHLLGEGGDVVLDGDIASLVDLARMGRLVELEEACQTYAHANARSPQELLENVKSAAPRTIQDDLLHIAQLVRGPETVENNDRTFRWIKTPSGDATKFLTDTMRVRIGEASERRALETSFPEGVLLGEYLSTADLRQAGLASRSLRSMASEIDLEVSMPYLDHRVATACLKLPAHLRVGAHGVFKPILQTAFPDILPTILANRTTKGTYTSVAYKGLRRAAPVIRKLFDRDCRLAELAVIKPEVVREEIDKLDMGWKGAFPALDYIISAEVWLRQRESVNT